MNETHAIMLAFTPTEPNGGAIMPPAHGMRASHFPASVSVDEGNGQPHSCGRRTAPKAAIKQNTPDFCPNAMRGCDLCSFKCEDEGAYLAYVTEAPLIAFGGGD